MKKTALIIFALGFILSGSIAQNTKDAVYDDVYYPASKKKKKDKKKKEKQKDATVADTTAVLTVSPDSVSSTLPKASTLEGDYNDYSYSARIKRFHNPEEEAGYYDETMVLQLRLGLGIPILQLVPMVVLPISILFLEPVLLGIL